MDSSIGSKNKDGRARASRMAALPECLCVLDVETLSRKGDPERAELGMTGIKVYTKKQKGTYLSGQYTCFWPDEDTQLETWLREFPGIILGFNLFGFDYKVLGQRCSLNDTVEKTVDILALLRRIVGWRRDLDLGRLAELNCLKHKLITGKSLATLLSSGDLEGVWCYNERDCELAFSVWWHSVRTRTIRIPRDAYSWEPWMKERGLRPPQPDLPDAELSHHHMTVRIPETEWGYWCGKQSPFTRVNWRDSVSKEKARHK